MRAVVLRSFVVIGAGGLVLAGVLYVASTVDARPPEVLEIGLTQALPDNPQRAAITTSLEIVFSEPVIEAGAIDALRIEPAVEGSVSWSGSSMIFTPDDRLELDTRYTASIAPGVVDLAGNEMSELPRPFEFQTAGRPSLVGTDPDDGAEGVSADAPIVLTFSTLMDTASVEAALDLAPSFPHQLRWSEQVLEIVPDAPLQAGTEYEVSVGASAADVAGVTLGASVSLGFRVAPPGLAVELLFPADGIAGIAQRSSIVVIFDRPVDPASVSDEALSIQPSVAGALELTPHPEDAEADDGASRVLRFTPSAPLPPNTTFEVQVADEVAAAGGGGLVRPTSWSFTTGAPQATISNQVTFITERAGIANVWAMNPDGTGKHQLSAELAPVIDYAVAPDGRSLVVADGRRLVFIRADGSDRRVLTGEGTIDFDPAYTPDGRRLAFARLNADTGDGLGIWEWEIGAGNPTRIELPLAPGRDGDPGEDGTVLRAPRYSPDGQALAFVDLAGNVGLLELPGQRLTLVPFEAAAPPVWRPGSAGLLLTGREQEAASSPEPLEAPVMPMSPSGNDHGIFHLARSGTTVSETAFGDGAWMLAVGPDGRIAYLGEGGALRVTDAADTAADAPIVVREDVLAGAFAPGEPAMVIVVESPDGSGSVELLDIDTGRRTSLEASGSRPRWLP